MSATPEHKNVSRVDELLAARDWIERLARRLVATGDRSGDAEDLAQETFAAALEDSGRRAQSGPALRGWFGSVMRRRASEERRGGAHRRGREEDAARPEGQPDSTLEVERAELRRFLVDEVLRCTEPVRSTLVLRYFEGHSYAEVAKRTGTTAVAARQRAARGLAQLRERLDKRSGGDRSVWLSALAPLSLPLARPLARPLAGSPAKIAWGYAVIAACLVSLAVIGTLLLFPRGEAPAVNTLSTAAVEVPLGPSPDVATETGDIDAIVATDTVARQAAVTSKDTAQTPGAPAQSARLAFPPISPEKSATLAVEVISATSSRPVPNYPLQVAGRTVDVDGRGRALVSGLTPGETFYASPLGAYGSIEIEAGMTESLTIRAEDGYVLHGRVTDGAGEPLSGAEVRGATGSGSYGTRLAASGADGLFAVQAVAGRISLFAVHPDAGVSKSVWLPQAPEEGELVELVVSSGTAAVSLQVVDELDVPLAGARITLEPLPRENDVEEGKHWNPDWRFLGHTDPNGSAVLEACRPGPSRLIVATAELATHVEEIHLIADETFERAVRLRRGRTLGGRVLLSKGGSPARRVSVLAGDDFHWDGVAATTDDDGGFLIPKVSQDQATITVQPFFGEREVFAIEPGTGDALDLLLELASGWHTAEGEVVDEDGEPLVGWDLTASSGYTNLGVGTTDERGYFRTLAIAPHFRSLAVRDPDVPWSGTTVLGVLPSTTPLRIVVPREHMGTSRVHGVVHDPDGSPVADAGVFLYPFLQTMTDAAGAFEIPGVRAGTHPLEVIRDGFATAQIDVTFGQEDDVDLGTIRLERGRTLHLEVTFEPAVPEEETVEIYEPRGPNRLAWLADVQEGPFEVTRASHDARQLVLRSRSIYHEVTLEESALEGGLQVIRVAWLPPRIVELRYANADGSEILEDEIVSLGQSWTLKNEAGQIVREKRSERRRTNGGELRIAGVPDHAVWTLHVVDDEGRSGTVELTGARQALEMR